PPAIGTFTVAVSPPTAAAGTHTVNSVAEPATYQFTVTYSDTAPIDYSTVNGNNNAVTVAPPAGVPPVTVTFVSATPTSNAATIAGATTFDDGAADTITLTGGELSVNTSMTVTGPGPSALTVSGNTAGRVFDAPFSGTQTIAISGMHLTAGNALGSLGGAIDI